VRCSLERDLPAGDATDRGTDYTVQLNSSPETVAAVRPYPDQSRGSARCCRDVGESCRSYAEQRGIVHVNGKRATNLAILEALRRLDAGRGEATRDTLP